MQHDTQTPWVSAMDTSDTTEASNAVSTKKYWRSLEELNNDPKFLEQMEQEFMSSPLSEDDGKDGESRRGFLKLMGASMALATASCVRRPVQRIVPYSQSPLEIMPGKSVFYSTTFNRAGQGGAFLVRTREGRPLKMDGNPMHPVNQGVLTAQNQAYLLSLYDLDRLKGPQKVDRASGSSVDVSWDDLDNAVVAALKEGEVAILTSTHASPTTKGLTQEFLQAFKGRVVTWDPLGADEILEGQRLSYGRAVIPRYRFEKAKMIVSIDCDFLGTWGNAAENAKGFGAGRKPGSGMSKFVAFESILSLTGSNADVRVRIRPSQQADVAMGLLYEIAVRQGLSRYAGDARVKGMLAQYADVAKDLGIEPALFSEIAKDLWENRGQSLVVAGGLSTRTANGLGVQVAVNLLNSALDNDGKTIDGTGVTGKYSESSLKDLIDLIKDMKSGKIRTLLIQNLNPIYALPRDLGFQDAVKSVKTIVSLSRNLDETAKISDFVAPDHHELENWGDCELQDGVLSIQQPVIRPLYNTRAFQFSLMSWAFLAERGPKNLGMESWYEYLKFSWKQRHGGLGSGQAFDAFWVKLLQDGVFDRNSKDRRETGGGARSFNSAALAEIKKYKGAEVELVLYPKVSMGDGSLANNAWLQELSDPVTKISWDNYLSVGVAFAKARGFKEGQYVNIKVKSETLKVPVHIQPGTHDGVVGLAVGYGRTSAGSVGNDIGVNAWHLAHHWEGQVVFSGMPVEIEKTGEVLRFASVQDHHTLDDEATKFRQIVVEATLADYMKKKSAGIHPSHVKMQSIWKTREYTGHKWGMSIDLTSCIGCSACTVACQSENNVPVVGKKYMLKGREMHWIRIDRYYTGSPDNPSVMFQPMLCQHCDNAPCETVCPVAATVHDDQGLNTMIYNRCVGTRYCSNNCPYKVRRFNWFNYNIEEHPYTLVSKPLNKALNPDVTVRFRGVMEKCTFCIHKIKEATHVAKGENRELRDGDIVTACEASCPTGAIVFGDMNDPNSRVSQKFQDERTYKVLEETNSQPSVRYMTRIKNKKASAHHEGDHS